MKKPKTIPPTYLYAGVFLIIVLFFVFPHFNLIPFPYNLLGGLLILIGVWLNIWPWQLFNRAGTTEKYVEPTNAFVKDGPFRFSRHPMYLGMFLLLIGLAVCFKNILGFISPLAFFAIMHFVFINYEEKEMEDLFGQSYLDYKKQSKKWFGFKIFRKR